MRPETARLPGVWPFVIGDGPNGTQVFVFSAIEVECGVTDVGADTGTIGVDSYNGPAGCAAKKSRGSSGANRQRARRWSTATTLATARFTSAGLHARTRP